MLTDAMRIKMLTPPTLVCDAVIDSDIDNEIDDLFALVYAIKSPRINVKAVYAAPFHDDQYGDSKSPLDGMERSYKKGQTLLRDMNTDIPICRGSDRFMVCADDAVDSEAARDLVKRANAQPEDAPLYVVAIGCPVNIASALLLDPKIREKIVVLWLASHTTWNQADEFNLRQDVYASGVLFDSGVPLVLFSCVPVTETLHTTLMELRYFLADAAPIGKWLLSETEAYHTKHGNRAVWKKTLWDVAPVAWLIQAEWVPTRLTHAPILTSQRLFARDDNRHLIRMSCCVRRDPIMEDLFRMLESPAL